MTAYEFKTTDAPQPQGHEVSEWYKAEHPHPVDVLHALANLLADHDRQKARADAMEAALEFYRDQWDWGPGNVGTNRYVPSSDLLDDRGEVARAALSPMKGEG